MNDPQQLYIIGASRDGPLKIGISVNPETRRRELQTGHPNRLHIYWRVPNTHAAVVEDIAHRILDRWRLAGEWFDVSIERAMAAVMVADLRDDADTATDQELLDWSCHTGICECRGSWRGCENGEKHYAERQVRIAAEDQVEAPA